MGSSRKLLVGVDEAGYGPNLGPLVVVATWLEVPSATESAGLWDQLSTVVCRHPAPQPHFLVIDDSKRVYSLGTGLSHLERAALAWIGIEQRMPSTLRQLWAAHCLTAAADIDESPWYADQDVQLPRHSCRDVLERARRNLSGALVRAGFQRPGLACQIIMPRRFNELVRRVDCTIGPENSAHRPLLPLDETIPQTRSKAAALFQVNAELLRHIWRSADASEIEVVLDKHGGRNFYGPLLQQAFHETLVLAGREGRSASHYTITAAGRRLRASFVPRADSRHLLVAAASMTAKYLRELWMELFNSFWTRQLPDLEPTAGYPTDARRFWRKIQPLTDRLGLAKQLIWRER